MLSRGSDDLCGQVTAITFMERVQCIVKGQTERKCLGPHVEINLEGVDMLNHAF